MKIVRKKMLLFFITVLKIQFSIGSGTFKSLLTSVATAWLGRRTISTPQDLMFTALILNWLSCSTLFERHAI